MTLGAALQQSAAQLFALHGYEVTLSRPDDTNGSTYDPTTGGMIDPDATLTWTATGFFVEFKTEEIDGTSIRTGDRKLLVQAKGLVRPPEINDLVDSTLTILDVKQVRSGPFITHYSCPVRG